MVTFKEKEKIVTEEEHEGTLYSDENILYLDADSGYMGVYHTFLTIYRNSLSYTLKICSVTLCKLYLNKKTWLYFSIVFGNFYFTKS